MASVTAPASILETVAGWNVLDQHKENDFLIYWDHKCRVKVFVHSEKNGEDVSKIYDVDFAEWEKLLPDLKETNLLKDEDYSV